MLTGPLTTTPGAVAEFFTNLRMWIKSTLIYCTVYLVRQSLKKLEDTVFSDCPFSISILPRISF